MDIEERKIELVYRDVHWDPCERRDATFDPFGRRMDECIEQECHREPRHYLVTIDDTEMHTRLCPDHMWTEYMQTKYNMRLDLDMT